MTAERAHGKRSQRAVGIAVAAVLLAGGAVAVQATRSDGSATPPGSVGAADASGLVDVSTRDRAIATRSTARTKGPRVVPAATTKKPECQLDLGYGVWAIDLTAARSLTMLAAVAYRDGLSYVKAARAFEHGLTKEGRVPLRADQARSEIRFKRLHPVPRTTSLDAVYALFRPHTLTCVTPQRGMPQQLMASNGLTLRTIAMIRGWAEAYGGRPIGGFAPGGVSGGHIENSAHYDGRAVDIFFSLSDPDNKARGWLLAHWLIAHADYYQIATLIFDDTVWSNVNSVMGWRPYVHPSGDSTNVTLRHLDHIHADVVRGYAPQ
ncbi:hypothetical protein [Sporichthya sp.]|uniref:hypothetical protein n=1 Tax=Sporichthya sp. TaxID=65475 RepID=UPI0018263D3E|nr:hypothetical protein [Sporichthya sp.]MBA3741994.1 hypothetical protein [Sporichthya sp.]